MTAASVRRAGTEDASEVRFANRAAGWLRAARLGDTAKLTGMISRAARTGIGRAAAAV